MLTKKQELFFKLIVNCYYEEKKYPNLKTLKQKSNYKSYNTIYKYINQLEKKGYIKINSQKEIIYIKESLFNDPFLNIPIINEKQTIMLSNSFFKTGKEYIGFQIHDNKLNSYCLKNGDILIIEKSFLPEEFLKAYMAGTSGDEADEALKWFEEEAKKIKWFE